MASRKDFADKTEFRREVVLSVLGGTTYAEAARKYNIATPNARYFVHDYLRRIGIQPDERQDMHSLHEAARDLLPQLKITASLPDGGAHGDLAAWPIHALKIETALVVRFNNAGINTIQEFLTADPAMVLLIRSVTADVYDHIQRLIAESNGAATPERQLQDDLPLVLVVDPEATARRAIVDALTSRGIDVIEAEDGEQATTLYAEHHPSLCVVNLSTPTDDPINLCGVLAQRVRGARNPVVAIGDKNDDTIEKAFAIGVSDYFPNDYSLAILKHRVSLLIASFN